MAVVQQSSDRLVLRNSAWNGVGFFWSAAVLFFQVTWLLNRLGPEAYGIWSLAIALSSYFGLLDFGFGSTLVRFIAAERGNREGLDRVVTNASLFYLGVSGAVLLFIPAVPWAIRFLNIPPALQQTAVFVARISIVNFVVSSALLNLFLGVLHGLQRMDLSNKVLIAVSVPRVLGIVFVVLAGRGIRGVILVELGATVLTLLLLALSVRRLLPELRVRSRLASRKTLGELFRFGTALQVSVLSSLVNFQLDKLLLSKFVGLTPMAFYDLGARVAGKARGLPLMVFSSLLPAFSSVHAEEDPGKLRTVYLLASKSVTAITLPLFIVLALVARPLVQLWLGTGHELTVAVLRVLALAYGCNVLTVTAGNVVQAMGRPGIVTRAALIQIALNVTVSLALLPSLGIAGILIGTSAALLCGGIYLILRANALLSIGAPEYASTVLNAPILYAVLSAAGGFAAQIAIGRLLPGDTTAARILELLAGAGGFGGLYLTCLVRGRYLGEEERARLRAGVFGLFAGRLRHAR